MEALHLGILSDENQEQLCGGAGGFGGVVGSIQKISRDEFGMAIPLTAMDLGYEPSYVGRAIAEETQNPIYNGGSIPLSGSAVGEVGG